MNTHQDKPSSLLMFYFELHFGFVWSYLSEDKGNWQYSVHKIWSQLDSISLEKQYNGNIVQGYIKQSCVKGSDKLKLSIFLTGTRFGFNIKRYPQSDLRRSSHLNLEFVKVTVRRHFLQCLTGHVTVQRKLLWIQILKTETVQAVQTLDFI